MSIGATPTGATPTGATPTAATPTAATRTAPPRAAAGHRPVVAIVGAGAAGTIAAAQLAATAGRTGRQLDILLIDPRPDTGRGVAYSTLDRQHRLNVPAGRMSALAENPGHFLDWLRAHRDPAATTATFAARTDYGCYLAAVLAEAVAGAAGQVRLERIYERATGLARHGAHLRLRIGTAARAVDAVVLALGNAAPGVDWASPELRNSARFIADPWAPAALVGLTGTPASAETTEAAGHAPVLLVGTGLTMVDVALSLAQPGRVLHSVSRHGVLPKPHVANSLPPVPAPELPPGPLRLSTVRRLVRGHLAKTIAELGDWRPAFDGLRPITSELWQRLSTQDKAKFARTDARHWEVHRHRMAPEIAAAVDELRAGDQLRLHTGQVAKVHEHADGLTVTLTNGTTLEVAAVINCTGPQGDLSRLDDPLLLDLLTSGWARPGSLGIGLDTDADGAVLGSGQPASRRLWTLGSPRRGQLWESSAIPEIRQQAAELASHVMAVLPQRRRASRPRDPYGLPLSTGDEAAAQYNEALGKLLRVQSGAEKSLRQAVALDPGFGLAHAGLALLGHEWGAEVDVPSAIRKAQEAVTARGDERERSFVGAVTARILQPGRGSAAALLGHLADYPEDALAASVAVPTIAFSGATELPEETWSLVEGLAPAYGQDWWYSGLLAFIRQEQERWDEAAALSEQALAEEPASGHAVHARAHVYYETGAHEHGLAFLDPWITSCGREASHRAHFAWHAALHELALGEDDAVRRRYERQLTPPAVTGMRALVDSASLLWRCELAGSWDGPVPIGEVLKTVEPALLTRPATGFAALHSAMALTAAADAAGLDSLRRHSAAQSDPLLREVIAPLAGALIEVVEGRFSAAADQLAALLSGVARLGGSAAQREIVEDTRLYCLVCAGRCDEARVLLEKRLDRRPSPRDHHRLLRLSR